MLFLHLLMMASALLCFSGADKFFHSLEDLVRPPQVLIEEMLTIEFKKPMISLVLISGPMAFLNPLSKRFDIFPSFFALFFRSRCFQDILRLRFRRVTCELA